MDGFDQGDSGRTLDQREDMPMAHAFASSLSYFHESISYFFIPGNTLAEEVRESLCQLCNTQ